MSIIILVDSLEPADVIMGVGNYVDVEITRLRTGTRCIATLTPYLTKKTITIFSMGVRNCVDVKITWLTFRLIARQS